MVAPGLRLDVFVSCMAFRAPAEMDASAGPAPAGVINSEGNLEVTSLLQETSHAALALLKRMLDHEPQQQVYFIASNGVSKVRSHATEFTCKCVR